MKGPARNLSVMLAKPYVKEQAENILRYIDFHL